MAESFFSVLKNERVYRTVYATKAQARRDIIAYIEGLSQPPPALSARLSAAKRSPPRLPAASLGSVRKSITSAVRNQRSSPAGFASRYGPLSRSPARALDAGLRPDPFPDRAASLLPGLLAATRTGLAPAGDGELTNEAPLHQDPSVLLGVRKIWVNRKF